MTPWRTWTLLASAILISVASACSTATETGAGQIEVSDARVPVPAGPNGAAYMTLTNPSDTADRLISASSDVAEAVELHESTLQDGSMAMQQVNGIDVPAGGQATLEPGGYHVMLIGVAEGLAEGDTVALTLSFEQAGEQTVDATVVPLGDTGADMGSEGHMGMSSER